MKESVDKYHKLIANYEQSRKSYEDTYLDGLSILDVVIPKPKEEEKKRNTISTNANQFMPNPLLIDKDGRFNLDLLRYNLEHKTNLKELPSETSSEPIIETRQIIDLGSADIQTQTTQEEEF